jgi:hypothetical protein
MEIGARVGGTTNRDPPLTNIHLIGCAAAQKRQRLEWLQCRANKRFKARVSSRQQYPTLTITNNGMNPMD